ncbi:hypothetical protein PIB30_109899, partial [Stylosanthes scabra]|nr:hypothetical protein [Stylosanthes scabra]
MNRAESDNLLGDQCKTPDIPLQQQDLEERCAFWATVENNNIYETRMFDTYGTNYLDKKTKLPHRLELLKDHADYMGLLDRDKLKSHSALIAPVVYSNHWWLYVLDVDNKEFYIIDSVHGINPNQQRAKLHRFAPNPYDCGVYVMKWMELLDAATLSGCY